MFPSILNESIRRAWKTGDDRRNFRMVVPTDRDGTMTMASLDNAIFRVTTSRFYRQSPTFLDPLATSTSLPPSIY